MKGTLDIDKFWRDYEAAIGETVLARSLGRYIRGWDEYPEPLWGLAIATSGGFRFHHFPHESWIMGLSRITLGGERPKEKTFFIPRDAIRSVELVTEKRWWEKLLTSSPPVLLIRYEINGTEKELTVEVDRNAGIVADALKAEGQ